MLSEAMHDFVSYMKDRARELEIGDDWVRQFIKKSKESFDFQQDCFKQYGANNYFIRKNTLLGLLDSWGQVEASLTSQDVAWLKGAWREVYQFY